MDQVKVETPHPLIPLPARWLAGRGKLFFVRLTQGGGRPEKWMQEADVLTLG